MAEEEKKSSEEKQPEDGEKQAKAKSGLMKYIIFGGVGVVVVVAAVFVTLMFVGGGEQVTEAETDDHSEQIKVAEESSAHGTSHSDHGASKAHETSLQAASDDGHYEELTDYEAESELALLDENDQAVIDDIVRSLEILDYVPEGIGEEHSESMSVEDSVETVNWLDSEKAALTARENDVKAREKAISKLDKEVTRKLLTLEQAESTRISQLAKLYDGMEPRAVSKLIANLDDATVVSLLPRMKQKNASNVMSMMPAKRAARLSKLMITIAEN
ncbi:MAG: hypothetical protein DRP45_05695 [Candidatus Zixiibacteriota bacterium]|nr:MAG: hypothetical protein DRP45_05695 [candidate division Zixibacteria bacterium]